MVCYGGSVYTGGPILHPQETRVWTGSAWVNDWSLGTARGKEFPALACDPGRGLIHMFGNDPFAGTEHWTLSHPAGARFANLGSGCSGSTGIPRLDLADGRMPWLGHTAMLTASNLVTSAAVIALGSSSSPWGAIALPLPLAAFGMPTYSLLVSVDANATTVGSGGTAALTVLVPNATWLVGVDLWAQAFSPDLAANAAGVVVSQAVRLGLGNR